MTSSIFKDAWKIGLGFGFLPIIYFIVLLGFWFTFKNIPFPDVVILPVKPLAYAAAEVSEDWNALNALQILWKILFASLLLFGLYFIIGLLCGIARNKFRQSHL